MTIDFTDIIIAVIGLIVSFVANYIVPPAVAWLKEKRLYGAAATVVAAAIIGMLGAVPKSMLKSLTFDNGKEFAEFCQLEQALGLKVYFAKPYHSWERGTNENRNGIVRRVLPKGRSFEDILNAELERIDHLLNDRPMKCLDWRTPREAHNALLRRHALADAV